MKRRRYQAPQVEFGFSDQNFALISEKCLQPETQHETPRHALNSSSDQPSLFSPADTSEQLCVVNFNEN